MFYNDNSSSESLSSDLQVFSEESSEFSDFDSQRRVPTKVRITILDDDDFNVNPQNINCNPQSEIVGQDNLQRGDWSDNHANHADPDLEAENIRRSSVNTTETVHCDAPLRSVHENNHTELQADRNENFAELVSSESLSDPIDNKVFNSSDTTTGKKVIGRAELVVPSLNDRTKDSSLATPPPQHPAVFAKNVMITPGSPITHHYKSNSLLAVENAMSPNEKSDNSSLLPSANQNNVFDKTFDHSRNLSYSTIEQFVYPKSFSPESLDDFSFGNSSSQLLENDNSQFSKLQQEKKMKRKQQRFSLNSSITPGFSKMLNHSRTLSKDNYESALNDILNFEIIESPANALNFRSDTVSLQKESSPNSRLPNSVSFSRFKSKLTKRFSSSSNDISKYNFPKDDLGIITNSAY